MYHGETDNEKFTHIWLLETVSLNRILQSAMNIAIFRLFCSQHCEIFSSMQNGTEFLLTRFVRYWCGVQTVEELNLFPE